VFLTRGGFGGGLVASALSLDEPWNYRPLHHAPRISYTGFDSPALFHQCHNIPNIMLFTFRMFFT
jgi:hypothetical protein